MLVIAAVAAVIAAGAVWASNNVQPVRNAIGR